MTDEELLDLLQRFQEGEKEAAESLCLQLKPLVGAYARRMAGGGASGAGEHDDYYQVGMMGLCKAARRFDPARNVKFITFAIPWIEGEMRLHRRRNGNLLKVSRSLQDQSRRLGESREQLSQQLKREPTLGEIAADMEIAPEEIAIIAESALPLAPLDDDLFTAGAGENEEEKLLDRLILLEAMMKLTPLERRLIALRFFEELTQDETGGRLALSQRQVSRFEKRILRQMRTHMQTPG